jgi:hypothetical protein
MAVCVCLCVCYVSNFPVLKRHRHVLQQLDYCNNSNIKHDALIILDVCLQPWTDIHMKYTISTRTVFTSSLYFKNFNNVHGKHCTVTQHMHVCNKICHHYTYSFVGGLPDDGHAKAETCSKQTVVTNDCLLSNVRFLD